MQLKALHKYFANNNFIISQLIWKKKALTYCCCCYLYYSCYCCITSHQGCSAQFVCIYQLHPTMHVCLSDISYFTNKPQEREMRNGSVLPIPLKGTCMVWVGSILTNKDSFYNVVQRCRYAFAWKGKACLFIEGGHSLFWCQKMDYLLFLSDITLF